MRMAGLSGDWADVTEHTEAVSVCMNVIEMNCDAFSQ
jgi:hypothetical protein